MNRKKPWQKKPSFGSLYTVKGSPYIYISMYYFRERLRFPTDKEFTKENWQELVDFMDEVGKKIRHKTFVFAKTFYWLDEDTKEHFTQLEEGNSAREHDSSQQLDGRKPPDCLEFGVYARDWMARKVGTFTPSKRRSYNCAMNRLLPHFKNHTFDKITTRGLEDFIDTLHKSNAPERSVTLKRIKNILGPMGVVWRSAYNEYNWDLRDPFPTLQGKFEEIQTQLDRQKAIRRFKNIEDEDSRATMLLAEWKKALSKIDPHYHVVMELLIRGMIGSELDGLLKEDIKDDHIYVCHKVFHESVKQETVENGRVVIKKLQISHFEFKLKNWYRERQIPFSGRLKELLFEAMNRSKNNAVINFNDLEIGADQFVLTMKDGSPFKYRNFIYIWNNALAEAGVSRRVPYACRHTFVQWALLVGITKTRLVDIMGHADKSMVDRIYGNYRKGLADEKELILEYLGEDFLSLDELRVAFPHRYAARLAAEASKVQTENTPDHSVTFIKSVGTSQVLYPDNYTKK